MHYISRAEKMATISDQEDQLQEHQQPVRQSPKREHVKQVQQPKQPKQEIQVDTFVQTLTIRQMEEWVKAQRSKIESTFEFQQLGSVRSTLQTLSSARRELDNLTRTISDAYASINAKLIERIKIFKRQLQAVPDAKDEEVEPVYRSPSSSGVEFAPNVPANSITTVTSLSDIPDARLYWVNDIQQFALKVCGLVLRGNIGTIYPSVHAANKQVVKINTCRYGKMCRNITSPEGCNYFHDPLEMDIPDADKRREIRNFTNGSWLYTPEAMKESNKMMRHVGSRPTLYADITTVTGIEAQCWVDQTIHSILVTLALYQQGKVPLVRLIDEPMEEHRSGYRRPGGLKPPSPLMQPSSFLTPQASPPLRATNPQVKDGGKDGKDKSTPQSGQGESPPYVAL